MQPSAITDDANLNAVSCMIEIICTHSVASKLLQDSDCWSDSIFLDAAMIFDLVFKKSKHK